MQEEYSLKIENGGQAFFVLMTVYILIAFLGQTLLEYLYGVKDALYYSVSVSFSLISIISVLLFCKVKGQNFFEKTCVKKFNPFYILPAILLFSGMLFGLGFLNSVVENIVKSLGGRINNTQIPLDFSWQYILFSFLFAVIPAVEEEIFFRGYMLGGVKNGFKLLPILSVSLCFSLYHGSISQLFYQFIFGIGACFLTIKAKSVIPSMISHFLNNFVILTFQFFKISVDFFSPLTITIGGIFLILFGLTFLYDRNSKPNCGGVLLKDFWFPYGIIGIFLCLVLVIGGVI